MFHMLFFLPDSIDLFNSIGNVTMRTTLSKTTLATGPSEALKVKDVYGIVDTAGNTSIKDVLMGLKDESIDTLRKTPKLASQLTELILGAKSGKMNLADSQQRIGSIFNNRGGVLDQLTTRATSMMANTLGMDPSLSKKVLMSVKGIGSERDSLLGFSSNMTSSQGIVSSIQRLLGDKDALSFVDLEAEAALLSGLLGEAIKAGIPQAVDLLLKETTSQETRRQVASRNMYAVVFSGNLNTVEKLTTHIAPEALRAKYPNFARDFLAQFALTAGDKANDHPGIKTRILALFNKVDPNWDKSVRNGVLISSLSPFVRASDDAKTVFETSSAHRSAITIAGNFNSVEIKSWIKKRYKYFPA